MTVRKRKGQGSSNDTDPGPENTFLVVVRKELHTLYPVARLILEVIKRQKKLHAAEQLLLKRYN